MKTPKKITLETVNLTVEELKEMTFSNGKPNSGTSGSSGSSGRSGSSGTIHRPNRIQACYGKKYGDKCAWYLSINKYNK